MGGDDKNRMSQTHPPPLPKVQTNDEGEDREGEDTDSEGRHEMQRPKRAQMMQNVSFGP